MTGSSSAGSASPDCGCKLGRTAAAYGLDDAVADLVARWTGADGERTGVRDLTDEFNLAVLRAAMADAGVEFLDGEVANVYRLFTDDDVSSGMRTHARNRLRRQGVAVDDLEAAFVSHQTTYSHLTDCAGASLDGDGTSGTVRETAESQIRALQNRTAAVTTDRVTRLRDTDEIALDGFDVFVEVAVACERCGARYEFGDLLDGGGCDCATGPD